MWADHLESPTHRGFSKGIDRKMHLDRIPTEQRPMVVAVDVHPRPTALVAIKNQKATMAQAGVFGRLEVAQHRGEMRPPASVGVLKGDLGAVAVERLIHDRLYAKRRTSTEAL